MSYVFHKQILFVLIILLVTACAAKIVLPPAVIPPEAPIRSKSSPVAILPFDGPKPWADYITAEVERILVQSKINNSPYYEVVERNEISKVIDELKFSHAGFFVDEETAAEVGKFVAAKTIIIGKVTMAKVLDIPKKEKRKKCVRYIKTCAERDVYGYCLRYQELDICEKWEDCYIPCICRKGLFEMSYKIIDVETGRVIYANSLSGESHESKICHEQEIASDAFTRLSKSIADLAALFSGSEIGKLQDKISAIKESMRPVIRRLEVELAPRFVTLGEVSLKLKDKNAPQWVNESIKNGVNWAKNGRLDRACEIWRNVYRKFPNSSALNYNLGICEEVRGNLIEALEFYKKADKMLVNPEKDISNALSRIKWKLRAREELY